jgi:hypothetical protein
LCELLAVAPAATEVNWAPVVTLAKGCVVCVVHLNLCEVNFQRNILSTADRRKIWRLCSFLAGDDIIVRTIEIGVHTSFHIITARLRGLNQLINVSSFTRFER